LNSSSTRLTVVDALRGFSIVAIMLLHNIEHFDFYNFPDNLPPLIQKMDHAVWETLFFLFGGKVYAIFALLFGLTFYIQSHNQEKRGKDFRGRFAWRLLLLLGFGLINSAFYEGDILTIYALTGLFLIPVARLSNKAVFWIALILMLQPYLWIDFFQGLQDPTAELANPQSWAYFGKMNEYIPGTSFFATCMGNLTNGKKAVLIWTWENGRSVQTLSLFMFGMLAGRYRVFTLSDANNRLWTRTLILASISFVLLYFINRRMGHWIDGEAVLRPLKTIETSWMNMAFMLVLIAGFFLLYQRSLFYLVLDKLSPIGKMSLSNYLIQSVIGSTIYYGFGLGLYRHAGPTYSILIGILLAVLQGYFSSWWMKHHKRGPLETLWHKATWIGNPVP
jgi:uncharacterized protein